MSVDCDMYLGYTVTIRNGMTNEDFDELDKFENAKYNGRDGKIKLVIDGMNGDYARLIYVDRHNKYVYGDENEPYQEIDKKIPEGIYKELNEAYMEIQGVSLDKRLVKYALWWHWY